MPFTVHVTLSPCCREREREKCQEWCGYPIHHIWIWWTTASEVSFKRGSTICVSMMWRSWKNVCWASGGCWTMHTIIVPAIVQWCSHLNACVRVNGGHFEHKFWAPDFLLCFVCFIDTSSPKCDRYRYVQSANIVSCVSFMSETFTCYPYAYPFHLCF